MNHWNLYALMLVPLLIEFATDSDIFMVDLAMLLGLVVDQVNEYRSVTIKTVKTSVLISLIIRSRKDMG